MCVVHLYRNFVKEFPSNIGVIHFVSCIPLKLVFHQHFFSHAGALFHSLFWATTNTYNAFVFTKAMDKIKIESKEPYEWLMAVPLEQWARHKFDHSLKCPDNTTNLVESFNDRIKKLRHKPMFTLLEEIRRKIIETIATRFDLPQN